MSGEYSRSDEKIGPSGSAPSNFEFDSAPFDLRDHLEQKAVSLNSTAIPNMPIWDKSINEFLSKIQNSKLTAQELVEDTRAFTSDFSRTLRPDDPRVATLGEMRQEVDHFASQYGVREKEAVSNNAAVLGGARSTPSSPQVMKP
jgi:hypothetical protein